MKSYSKAVKKADVILYTILIFWVSIFIWASFASLEEVTSGQGRIIASSKIQIIQNLEGVIIEEGAVLSMGVFIVKKGCEIPLHDHPNMYGLW